MTDHIDGSEPYGDDEDAVAEAALDALDPDEEIEISPSAEKLADDLADAGMLTRQQALAFVLRDVESHARPTAAAMMGIDPSTLDTHLSRGREEVHAAARTIAVLDDVDGGERA